MQKASSDLVGRWLLADGTLLGEPRLGNRSMSDEAGANSHITIAVRTFRVTKIGLNGDTVFHKAFHYDPRPVTDEQFEKLVEERVAMVMDTTRPHPPLMRDAGAARRALQQAMVRPKYHPPISSAVAGADGTLWLQREDDGKANRLWQVMDENGRFIGAVRIPRKDRVHYASRRYVWVSQVGELDVPPLV